MALERSLPDIPKQNLSKTIYAKPKPILRRNLSKTIYAKSNFMLVNPKCNLNKTIMCLNLTFFLNVSLVNLYMSKAYLSKTSSKLKLVPKFILSKTMPKAYLYC